MHIFCNDLSAKCDRRYPPFMICKEDVCLQRKVRQANCCGSCIATLYRYQTRSSLSIGPDQSMDLGPQDSTVRVLCEGLIFELFPSIFHFLVKICLYFRQYSLHKASTTSPSWRGAIVRLFNVSINYSNVRGVEEILALASWIHDFQNNEK